MTDIVLIDPPSNYDTKVVGKPDKVGHLPHIGLLNIAAVLEKEGHKVACIDAKAMGLDIVKCCDEVAMLQPRYVGITSVTCCIGIAASLASTIKRSMDVPVILGGVHVSASPVETMEKYASFDVSVVGEGEITILELLKCMDEKKEIDAVKGIAFRKGEKVMLTGRRELISNLDDLPLPAWHLFPELKKYYQPSFGRTKKLPSMNIMTGRGCYGKCNFCDKSVAGNKVRKHSVDYVMDVIDVLYDKHGIRDIQIDEDVFVDLKKRAHEICDRMIEKNMDISWSCQARVNNVDWELLKKMKKAGCWQISYGIESGSQEILDFIGKDIKIDQIESVIKLTKKAGIKVNGFFILGHFMESKESLEKTIRFMLNLDLDYLSLGYFVPFPGTISYQIADSYGHFNRDWEKMEHEAPDSFVPNGTSYQELLSYKKKALFKFYMRPKIIFSWIISIRNLHDVTTLLFGALTLLVRLTDVGILLMKKK